MACKKEFDQWNILKKKLASREGRIFFREGEIWWCCVGVNIGSEQDGKGNMYLRPVLIYRKINNHTFLGIPLTRTLREDITHIPFYFDYDFHSVILSQIRIFDTKRLFKIKGKISDYLFSKIKKKVIALMQ